MTKIHITRAELFKASGLLTAHCAVDGEGFAVYEAGWDDGKIAAQISETLNASHIMRLREEAIGRTRPFSKSSSNKKLEELILKHNKLCETLSLNKVADVRHLRLTDGV